MAIELGELLSTAKEIVGKLSSIDDSLKDLRVDVKNIAASVSKMAEGIDRLVEKVKQLPKVIINSAKYAIQLQAAARRESAVKAMKAGVMDEAFNALVEAEHLEPVTYELWVLFIIYRHKASAYTNARLPTHNVEDELHKAARFTSTADELRAVEKLAVLYFLLVMALWYRERGEAREVLEHVVTILWRRGALTLANSRALLEPFRQLASGDDLTPLMAESGTWVQKLYADEYKRIWQSVSDAKLLNSYIVQYQEFGRLETRVKDFCQRARQSALPEDEITNLTTLEMLMDVIRQQRDMHFTSVSDRDSIIKEYRHNRKLTVVITLVLLVITQMFLVFVVGTYIVGPSVSCAVALVIGTLFILSARKSRNRELEAIPERQQKLNKQIEVNDSLHAEWIRLLRLPESASS